MPHFIYLRIKSITVYQSNIMIKKPDTILMKIAQSRRLKVSYEAMYSHHVDFIVHCRWKL